ncbi:MFS transporter [Glycomyces buryatensis]|uniref:MFS transporter n=1 Tax=Glycomyces buryatensis TaxID=2570927 RepID=A0A4S8QKA5_9ACTN|nr:MFS transporter [Glycomyces buryatensis]THV43425.1 MFS transporter [Glycomyces buryatensis]
MSPVIARQLQQTFRALSVPAYRIFATGQLLGTLGFWLQTTAVNWLVLELTGDSGSALGLSLAIQFGPYLFFSLQGGKIADAVDKRLILMACSLASAAVAGVLAVVVLAGSAEVWMVYLAVFVFGCVSVLEGPARQAFYSEIVEPEALPNAVSLGSAIFNVSRIAGPAIAGLLIAVTSTGTVLALNAAAFLGPAAACIVLLRRKLSNPVKRSAGTEGGIRESLRYVAGRPDLLGVLIVTLFVGGFAFNFPVTLSLLAKTEFATGADTFGLLLTALAVGALAGALASGRRSGRPGVYTVLGAGMALGITTTVVGFAPNLTTAMILLVPTGFAMVYFAQAANQRVQMGAPGDFRGRILSLYLLVFLGSTAIFAPLVGWVCEEFGARSGLWLGGVVAILATTAAWLGKRARLRRQLAVLPGKAMP